MIKLIRTSLTAFFVFIMFFLMNGQADIRIILAQDTIGIGEDLDLSLRIDLDEKYEMLSLRLSVLDSLGMYKLLMPQDTITAKIKGGRIDFEIANTGRWIDNGTQVLKGNSNGIFYRNEQGEIENDLKLKLWEPGDLMVIIEEMEFNDISGVAQKYYPEFRHAQMIHVLIPGELTGEELNMEPIKDILREGYHWTDFIWLFIAIGLAAIFIFIILRPKRNKKREEKKNKLAAIIVPAHIIANEKLKALKEKSLWQQGLIKEYQSELTYILREYLENRYQIKALESTTLEIVKDLKDHELKPGDIEMLRDVLQIADLVKFAKARPDVNIHEQFFRQAAEFVDNTKSITTDKSTEN